MFLSNNPQYDHWTESLVFALKYRDTLYQRVNEIKIRPVAVRGKQNLSIEVCRRVIQHENKGLVSTEPFNQCPKSNEKNTGFSVYFVEIIGLMDTN